MAMIAPFGIRPKGTLLVRMLPLAQALVRRGHVVSIVAPAVQNPDDAGSCVVYGGVPVRHVQLPRWSGVAGVVQVSGALLRAALGERPDVVHLFKPKGFGGLAVLAGGYVARRVPLVVDSDDWEGWGGWNDVLPYPRSAKMLFAWQERDLPRRAAAVTVASRTLETQVWGEGVAPGRVFYVPNGVAGDVLGGGVRRCSVGTTMLLYTRFWEFDVRDVVAALVAIVGRCPAARLVVVGRGERGEEGVLMALAQRAGVAGAIDYRGWVEPPAIPGLIAAADLALVPMSDTLINRARCSVKLLELMAAGLPIVAGRVGQVGEYLDDQRSGVLVPPDDPAALAEGALRLLGDAGLRARLGDAARVRVARWFTWDRLVAVVERAYAAAWRAADRDE